MNQSGVYHISEYIYAYAVGPETIKVRLKTAKEDIRSCRVYYKNVYDHTAFHNAADMQLIRTDGISDYYEAYLFLKEKRYKYYFELIDTQGEKWYFNSDGFSRTLKNPRVYFFMPYLFKEDVPDYPAWAQGGLIYQVFVDRFYNGNPLNKSENISSWDAPSTRKTVYGGDFIGLAEKLNYLNSLGVGILYLNPVFKSPTYHKYDISDYYEVDPSYGMKEELKSLVEKAHSLGMKVILDAVYNHSSDQNLLFKDVEEKGRASEYADWYDVKSFPITKQPPSYDCFAGCVPEMPRFETSNTGVQDYLIAAAEYWTKYLDIDGWRLDVADEISHVLWKKFRTRIKAVKKDCLILGEIWNQSTRWLMGDECDTSTNYKFRNTMIEFACNEAMDEEALWNALAYNEMKYKSSNFNLLVNLIGSHDTPRIVTVLNGDRGLARLVIGIMLTYTGMPLIYYGDEVGMQGGKDPDNRMSMRWDEKQQDEKIYKLVKLLGNLRKQSEALSKGILKENRKVPPKVMAYERIAGNGEEILVAANFGNTKEQIDFNIPYSAQISNITDSGEIKQVSADRLRLTVEVKDLMVITVKGREA